MPVASWPVGRVQLECLLEFLPRLLKVPIELGVDIAQGSVGLTQVRIQRQSIASGFLKSHQCVGIGQPGVGGSVIGLFI